MVSKWSVAGSQGGQPSLTFLEDEIGNAAMKREWCLLAS